MIKNKEDLSGCYAVRADEEVFELFMQKCEEFGIKWLDGTLPRDFGGGDRVRYRCDSDILAHSSGSFYESLGMKRLTLADFKPKTKTDNNKTIGDIGNELHNLSCKLQDSDDGEYLSSLAIECWDMAKPQPKTRTEYKPVTMRDFEALQEFHAAKEFYHKPDHARNYNTVQNVETLIQAHVGGWLYTKEEVEINWRDVVSWYDKYNSPFSSPAYEVSFLHQGTQKDFLRMCHEVAEITEKPE